MTTLQRALLMQDALRRGFEVDADRRRAIGDLLGDLIHALANAEQRRIALEYQLAELRASVVAAMSGAGPAEDERTG